MNDLLRQQLQSSLGGGYTLDRELGGGGMSRVFLADEHALGRRVVVKLLAPELAAGINGERFTREIRLAASLQQANIVPLLTAGASNGLPYYTMPFVEGESLRHRVAHGALPVAETLGILRDVAKALAYAHERGIVHRDIKPDNVLLSGGTAVVTDFGIAKALGAARATPEGGALTGGVLTALGSAIGTPAYMAPEQAAGDPNADHRLDLYAFGCLAYELLTGAAPFDGLAPQKLLAAHMTQPPRNVTELRPEVPPALAALVARCLEKEPSARPASARAVLAALDGITASGTTRALPAALLGAVGLRRALLVYAAAFAIVGVLARAATAALDVPDWVFPAALVLMVLGLPIGLLTAWVQRVATHAVTRTPTLTPGGTVAAPGTMATMALRAAPVMSWRRTRRFGLAAAALFVVLVIGVAVLRQLGIGPASSLFAAGALDATAPLLVADFRAVGDTSLGTVMADAVRSDLGQSRAITLLGRDRVADALQRMERDPSSRLDLPLAREVATREGVAAIIDGEVRQVGTSYLLTLRLVRADSATELAAYRATASGAGALVETLGDLTRKLRGRIGESLREVRASGSLEEVTTRSLDALRKYSAGQRARSEGNTELAIRFMEEAIAADTGFASAYARVGVWVAPTRSDLDKSARMIDAAWARRDRLSEVERLQLEGYRATNLHETADAGVPSARRLAELRPTPSAIHNLAVAEMVAGNLTTAESLFRRVIAMDPKFGVTAYGNLRRVLAVTRGDAAPLDSVAAKLHAAFPSAYPAWVYVADSARRRRDYARAERTIRAPCDHPVERDAQFCKGELAYIYAARGQLRDVDALEARDRPSPLRYDTTRSRVLVALAGPTRRAWTSGARAPLVHTLDSLERTGVIGRLPERNRPFSQLMWAAYVAGRPADVRRHAAEFERQRADAHSVEADAQRQWVRGMVALANGKPREAATALGAAAQARCSVCTVAGMQVQRAAEPLLAYAQDLSGDVRSAEQSYDRYLARADDGSDADFVAGAYKRLGELAAARGDSRKAITNFSRFVELWKDADPELQPQVRDVRARLARLQAQEARAR